MGEGNLPTRVTNLVKTMETFAPWLDAHFEDSCPLSGSIEIGHMRAQDLTLESIPRLYGELCLKLDNCTENMAENAAAATKHFRHALERAIQLSEDLVRRLTAIAAAAQSMADAMDFSILYDTKKKLFSIGFEEAEGGLSKYNYDLLASEARTAVFAAIAKGEAPQESWFHLKRSFRSYQGEDVMLSWSGTVFEYLMPCLWIRAYPNTLLDRTVGQAFAMQQKLRGPTEFLGEYPNPPAPKETPTATTGITLSACRVWRCTGTIARAISLWPLMRRSLG